MISTSYSEERFLALDFGEKRIGIAITDPLKMFAYPLVTLMNDNKLWHNLEKILNEYNIKKIILGYPLKENGEESSSTVLVKKFYEELSKRTNLHIEYFDERYSSDIAKSKILESVTSKKKRRDKGLVDKTAASVILSDYLLSYDKKEITD